jgi:hypothetical protein
VSGQVRQGVSIFFGCPDREIRCPDSLGRKFRFSWVSGHPTNVSGCPDTAQGDYVSGQVRQGVSIFFGCPDREIRCPDSLGRKFRFSWVSGHPTNVSGCPDTARVKTVRTRFHLISSALLPLPRDFLHSLT